MGQITDDRADRLLEDDLVLWLPSSPSWLAVTLVVLQFPGHVGHQRLRIWAAGRSPGVEEAVTAQSLRFLRLGSALGGNRRVVVGHQQFTLVLQLHLCCRCGPLLGACGRGRCGPLLGACGRGGAAMSVAVWSGSLVAWERELAALKERIGPVFGRAEVR